MEGHTHTHTHTPQLHLGALRAGMFGLFARAVANPARIAVVDAAAGIAATYGRLLADSARLAATLGGGAPLAGRRVVVACPPGYRYVLAQWACWRSGAVFVPLCPTHPLREWEYVIGDADPHLVVADSVFGADLWPLARGRGFVELTSDDGGATASAPADAFAPVSGADPALVLYTSGTTGRPKGVVHTYGSVEAQVAAMSKAWRWTPLDTTLNVLPLHHTHGAINVVTTSLWNGATLEMMRQFDAEAWWDRVLDSDQPDLSLFSAVPTVYAKLVRYFHDEMSPGEQQRARRACDAFRVMISGSMALPKATMDEWRDVSGHTLLERYGMTEVGMALTNPLVGERKTGHVGRPLPGVEARIAPESSELLIRGPAVFAEYWRRPDATRDAFDADGWFLTGDIAETDADGTYRILGRASVDILKSGGYKLSALEIETALLEHPAVRECAVIGLDDPEWGQKVAAIVVVADPAVDAAALSDHCKTQLSDYKCPRVWKFVAAIPRNAMGKVSKKTVWEEC